MYDDYTFRIETDGCQDTEHEVNYIEHIQLMVTIRGVQKEDIKILVDMTSPQGNLELMSFPFCFICAVNSRKCSQELRWSY